jgi:hypothetical protein
MKGNDSKNKLTRPCDTYGIKLTSLVCTVTRMEFGQYVI